MNNAKLYMPFQALKGYEEAIKKAAKEKTPRRILLEDREESINYFLNNLNLNDLVRIIYYNKDNYLLKRGIVFKIDRSKRYLLVNNIKIAFKDIYDIEVLE